MLSAILLSEPIGIINEKGGTAANAEFIETDSITFAQITDTHYYPLSYAYNYGGDNDYTVAIDSAAKVLLESSLMNKQAMLQILAEKPDYLLMSGDITSNGELQAHIEMSNLLRELQNKMRVYKPNFQVFVTPGNHDMYNDKSVRYDKGGMKVISPTINRVEFIKLYAGLGYPDLSDTEIDEFYDSLSDTVSTKDVPYVLENGKRFINSSNASDIEFIYQYDFFAADAYITTKRGQDLDRGMMTYTAKVPGGYTFICSDDEVSNEEINHHVGGRVMESSIAFLESQKAAFEGQTLFLEIHHNVIPHFALEPTLLELFNLFDWLETADYLADLGIRYAFTGHMHANDIVSHVSFNGNTITDTETSSLISYQGGPRFEKIQRGTIGGVYAENYTSKIDLLDEIDLTILLENGYCTQDYFDNCGLTQYIEVKDGKSICFDVSNYAAQKTLRTIAENMLGAYITPDFIWNAGEFIAEAIGGAETSGFQKTLMDAIGAAATQLIRGLINYIEAEFLTDYVYTGTNELYKADVPGAKLCGYVYDIVINLVNLPLNDQGGTLFTVAIEAYLQHLGGTDTPLAERESDTAFFAALNNLKTGVGTKGLIDGLLYNGGAGGLYELLEFLLTKPINFEYGLDLSEGNANPFPALELFNIWATMDRITIDKLVRFFVVDLIPAFNLDINLDMLGEAIDLIKDMKQPFTDENDKYTDEPTQYVWNYLNKLLDDYVTDSFYAGLGEIAYEILYEFAIDETPDGGVNEYSTTPVLPSADLTVTYLAGYNYNTATVENGKLPSMLVVTFGEDPKTTKNFNWFTDRRVEESVIQYNEGTTFNAATAVTVDAQYKYYATTTASIDLGVFATLENIKIGQHRISLSGLTPNTTYSFRVGNAENEWWSEVHTFKTAPDGNVPFETLLVTDLQGFANSTYLNADRILKNIDGLFGASGYEFVVNCGDTVDNSRNTLQFKYMLNTIDWGNTSQVMAWGNHEEYTFSFDAEDEDSTWEVPDYDLFKGENTYAYKEDYNYLELFYNYAFPEQDVTANMGVYYSFDFSGVHFTVLNTNDIKWTTRGTTKKIRVSAELGEQQYAWLVNDLSSTDLHKVVIMHKGIYSIGSHSSELDVIGLRNQLTSVFADYGVELVLAGHDHTYTESYYLDREGNPIEQDEDKEQYEVSGNGVLYITLGTFGEKFYKLFDSDLPIEFGRDEGLHSPHLSNPTFGILRYDGEKLYYIGYQYDLATDTIIELRAIPVPGYVKPEVKINANKYSLYIVIGVGAVILISIIIAAVKVRKKIKI
jgi:3',5'-cyclic AMP phosphodiesterase CpdA